MPPSAGTLFIVPLFTHSNPTRSLHGGCCDYPHFTAEHMETGGLLTSNSSGRGRAGMESRWLTAELVPLTLVPSRCHPPVWAAGLPQPWELCWKVSLGSPQSSQGLQRKTKASILHSWLLTPHDSFQSSASGGKEVTFLGRSLLASF